MAMNYSFQGVYKELLTGYVEEKYALGLKFTAQVRRLKQFDQLSFSFSCLTVDNLSRDIVDAFVYEPGITENTSRIRSCNIRNFAEYMLAHGKDAYVFPPRQFRAPPPYLPYIFTKEQIIRLFTELDSKASQFSRIRSRMDSAVIIRMLYGCGLRISEALNLRIQDVDLEQGILFIRSSKFDKDRTVPMSASLHKICQRYAQSFLGGWPAEAFFFSPDGKRKYSSQTIYGRFRNALFDAGIPHRGKGLGPRLHDLRHTFAVHSLQQMVKQGFDLYTELPILSTYLGHASVSAAQGYLRLTTEMFPEVLTAVENMFGDVYPEVLPNE